MISGPGTILLVLVGALAACGNTDHRGASGGSTTPAAESPATESTDATSPAPEAAPGQCPTQSAVVTATARYERFVDGSHRGCSQDADCTSVKLDCSNTQCAGVHRDFAATYPPIDCEGYAGPVADYDCLPRYGSERVVCADGCCISQRIQAP